MREQSQKLYGEPTKVNEELWKQFMTFQAPAMQSLVSAYMEQSRNVFPADAGAAAEPDAQHFFRLSFPGFFGSAGIRCATGRRAVVDGRQ